MIKSKGYVAKFKAEGKEVVAFGINFSSELMEVDDWKVVEMKTLPHVLQACLSHKT